MNKLKILFLIGASFLQCKGREPFKPTHGSINFLVYFPSRYRGLCVGTLVSRVAVITAAVCVTNPRADVTDTRAINVVVGTTYRHPRRGIRVQVTKLLIPNISKFDSGNRGYLMSKSVAIMLLKRKVPDILTEVPLRAIEIDWHGDDKVALQEECLTTGWHFFYKGDKIYPMDKFLLQRNLRVQFVDVVKKNLWCEALTIKFQKALTNLGFHGMIEKEASICIRDPDRTAQPCHGMYGAPLICRGIAVGLMMAPDGQWSNCTGYSNMIHLFASNFLNAFMTCVSRQETCTVSMGRYLGTYRNKYETVVFNGLATQSDPYMTKKIRDSDSSRFDKYSLFEADEKKPWTTLKKSMYEDIQTETYDYVPEFYDKITSSSASTDDEL